jgi:hypothetical protein
MSGSAPGLTHPLQNWIGYYLLLLLVHSAQSVCWQALVVFSSPFTHQPTILSWGFFTGSRRPQHKRWAQDSLSFPCCLHLRSPSHQRSTVQSLSCGTQSALQVHVRKCRRRFSVLLYVPEIPDCTWGRRTALRRSHSFFFYLREKARWGLYFVQRSRLTIFWFYHATTTRMKNVCMQGADLEHWSQAPSLLVQNTRERFSPPPHNKFLPTKRQRS